MEVNLWDQSAWWLELIFNILMLVLPTLAGLAVTTVFGKQLIKTVSSGWYDWVRPAVDQPTDPLVKLIAEKTGLAPEIVSEWLVEHIDDVVEALPTEELDQAKGAEILRKLRDAGVDV